MALQGNGGERGLWHQGQTPPQHSQPKGLVLLKVMSMGKFQTSVVGETLLLEVICEIPSSRPCRELGVSLGPG